MLIAPSTALGGIEYIFQPGDLLNTLENPIAINNAIGYQYTGADIAKGDIFRQGIAGAGTDTLPTANNILNALIGSNNIVSPPSNELYGLQSTRAVNLAWPANGAPFLPGSTFRRMIVQTTAFAVTMAVPASSGINFASAPYNTVNISASSWREYLFQINNSSPAQTFAMNQTNASPTLQMPSAVQYDLLNNITPGMSVYGTNIAASTIVVAVNRDAGTVTLSANATATLSLNSISFTPTITVFGLRSGTL